MEFDYAKLSKIANDVTAAIKVFVQYLKDFIAGFKSETKFETTPAE